MHVMPILVNAIALKIWVWAAAAEESSIGQWDDLDDEAREVTRFLAAGLIGAWMDARGLDLVEVAGRYLFAMSTDVTWSEADDGERDAARELGRVALAVYRELWQ
jgi:hypothetical protein